MRNDTVSGKRNSGKQLFLEFLHFLTLKKHRLDSILKYYFSPRKLFLSRNSCTGKILKFGAKRYSFSEKSNEKLLFSDFCTLFGTKKSPGWSQFGNIVAHSNFCLSPNFCTKISYKNYGTQIFCKKSSKNKKGLYLLFNFPNVHENLGEGRESGIISFHNLDQSM